MLFTANDKAKVDRKRFITVGALQDRLTFSERRAIRYTDNMFVDDIYKGLLNRHYIDLNLDEVAHALAIVLNYLTTVDDVLMPEQKTVLDEQARLAELLVDGEPVEQYNGVL